MLKIETAKKRIWVYCCFIILIVTFIYWTIYRYCYNIIYKGGNNETINGYSRVGWKDAKEE